MFFKRKPESTAVTPSDIDGDVVLSSTVLLEKNAQTLAVIKEQVATTPTMWSEYYLAAISRYAEYVQMLPASQAHHHDHAGGLLEHTLQTVAFAMKLRRGYILPLNTSPEKAVVVKEHWTWAVFVSALSHDLGKVATDVVVSVLNSKGGQIGRWSPYFGAMTKVPGACSYTYRYRPERKYQDHMIVSPILLQHIFCANSMDWLSREVGAQQAMLATLAGDKKNPVGTIVRKADSESARIGMGASKPARVDQNVMSLGDKIARSVRHLLLETDSLPLNRPGAAGFVTESDLWVVSKRFCDLVRTQMVTDGHTSVPSDNNRLMDVMTEYQIIQSKPDGKGAVWRAAVSVGDWDKTLTFLKLSLSDLFPEHLNSPIKPMDGSITPEVAADEEGGESKSEGQKAKADKPLKKESSPEPATVVVADQHEAEPAASGDFAGIEDEPSNFDGLEDAGDVVPSADAVVAKPKPVAKAEPEAKVIDVKKHEDRGNIFYAWLRNGIKTGAIKYNCNRAPVHVVKWGLSGQAVLLCSPKIFKDCFEECRSSLNTDKWEHVQRGFASLGICQGAADGQMVHTFQIKPANPKKKSGAKLKGFVINDPGLIFSTSVSTNPVLVPPKLA